VAREAVRAALRASGELAGAPRTLPYDAWPRTEAGAPAVLDGWHASFADTTGLALAVVASCPVAVDAEWSRRPRWQAARERFERAGELALLRDYGSGDGRGDLRDDVLALWTAKEALLKLAGVGLADLARCELLERAGERFRLAHGGRVHDVLVRRHDEHWIAVADVAGAELELHTLQPHTIQGVP